LDWAAQAQSITDNNGNVVGHIYDNRPGYGSQTRAAKATQLNQK
jgi:hypothetical protein